MATKKSGNPVGRPKTTKNPVGRPKGEATVMKEYRQRLLNSPRSQKVIDAIFDVALDSDHKHWPAAMKMIADRVVPVAGFEKDAGGTGRTKMIVEIKDAGVVQLSTEAPRDPPGDIIDAVYEEAPDIKDIAKKPRVVFSDPPKDGMRKVTGDE